MCRVWRYYAVSPVPSVSNVAATMDRCHRCLDEGPLPPCPPCFDCVGTTVSPLLYFSSTTLPLLCPLSSVFRIWRFHGQVMPPFRRGSASPLFPLFRVWRFLCLPCPPCFEHGVTTVSPLPYVSSTALSLCPVSPLFRMWRFPRTGDIAV